MTEFSANVSVDLGFGRAIVGLGLWWAIIHPALQTPDRAIAFLNRKLGYFNVHRHQSSPSNDINAIIQEIENTTPPQNREGLWPI
jgi:hypothetical protein